jgi:transcriptional regulator with XRE-family HTH domain
MINVMKQPELGVKISQLRKARGLTQEELVEKCNISVRTIQRIETGEVTPRIYTVKTILVALDYDFKEISEKKDIFYSLAEVFKELLLINIDINKPSDFLIKQLNIAWILGIVFFLLEFFEATAEYYRYAENRMIFSEPLYITLKVSVLISFILFQRGFIMIGGLFRNYLLKIMSFIIICSTVVLISYDIASVFIDSLVNEIYIGGIVVTYGVIGIIYGIALYRLRKSVGDLSKYAGILEIVAGGFFLTIIFSFVGMIVLIPAVLFEIIIIFKTIEIIKEKQEENNYSLEPEV